MKKFLAVLLSVCLLLVVAAPAMGETAYTVLQYFLYSSEEGGCGLGVPNVGSGAWDQDILLVVFNMNDNLISVGGTNSNGEREISEWNNIEFETSLLTVMKLCASWETLSGMLESGYTMGFVVTISEDELYITSKEDADTFYSSILAMITEE